MENGVQSAPSGESTLPLCVDLDGTLVATDTLIESLLFLAIRRPWLVFRLPFWLLQSRAGFKHRIADAISLPPEDLPYNQDVVGYIRAAVERHIPVILVTASCEPVAQGIASHLGYFQKVIASSATQNLKGDEKRRVLVARYGEKGFDYAGDSPADLHVWRSARSGILVGRAVRYRKRLEKAGCRVAAVFPHRHTLVRNLWRALRPHQWSKNVLVFLPLLMAHKLTDLERWQGTLYAFAAFCMAASSVYIVNDLCDILADRRHPLKRYRPFAAGDVSILLGLLLEVVLLTAAVSFAWLCGSLPFAAILATYLILSTAYSLYLKRVTLLDVMVLSGLYTSRVLAGGAASRVPLSTWLVGFSIFLFLSMALIKRVSELQRHLRAGATEGHVRGYRLTDVDTITTIGITSGCMAALVIVLYMNGMEVQTLYQHPQLLWTISPVFLYWINHLWIQARRGAVHEDPILYCTSDKVTYVVGLTVLLILLVASGYAG
jgi:4-hydroxybenzoate polyprenyltransferase